MTKLEELKAAYEAVPKATWVYDDEISAVIYADKYTVKTAADFGKIDNSTPLGTFIALAHNLMPTLIEAVELLADLNGYAAYNPTELFEDHPVVRNVRILLEKLE